MKSPTNRNDSEKKPQQGKQSPFHSQLQWSIAKVLLFIERTLLSSKRKRVYENNASRLHHAASLLASI